MSERTGLRRFLEILDRPALLRLAKAYRVETRGLPTSGLIDRLWLVPEADAYEIARHVLRANELRAAASKLGCQATGSRTELARRIAALLRWRRFEDARQYARSLGLTGHLAWEALRKKGALPSDVPAYPDARYRGAGWISWGDWLGTGNKGPRDYRFRRFEDARAFVRALELENSNEWVAWCRGDRRDLPARPADVPTNPQRAYRGQWKGLGDWLGTGTVSTSQRDFLPFAAARRLARSLGLSGSHAWLEWCGGRGPSGAPEKPANMPTHPARTYREEWVSWADWLGPTARVRTAPRKFRAARSFARSLELANEHEWRAWCRGELSDKPPRPLDIPTNPQRSYSQQGWKGWGDWLGTGNVATHRRTFLPFEDARRFARALRLRSHFEWREWCRTGLDGRPPRPEDVPSNPWRSYAFEWQGWADWLNPPVEKRREGRSGGCAPITAGPSSIP